MKILPRRYRWFGAVALMLITVASGVWSAAALADASNGPVPTGPPDTTRPAAIVYRPPGLSTASRVPLLVALYGADGCPQCMEGLTHFEAVADAHGFVVAYPGSTLVSGTPWTSSSDIPYISSLITQTESAQNIDPSRVYVAGFSAGGRFAYQLGCALSQQITAIAIVGSVQRPYTCSLSRPISELTIDGSTEAVNGIAASGIPSAYTVENWWAQRDGCTGAAQNQTVAPVAEQQFSSCIDGSSAGVYVIEGGHHTWPGCSCGLTPSDPDAQWNASDGIWSFFSAHQGGSLTSPDASLITAQAQGTRLSSRRVQTKLNLGEQVTVQQTLNGSTGRQLATIKSVLRVSGKGIAYLRVPRQLKQGRYALTLTITDSYGRTLKLTRTVRVAK